MAELIGVVASVIAIAGLGAKLSKSLYTAGDRAVEANHNLNRIASNVALFSGTLKYFATVLRTHETFFSDEAKNVAIHLLRECEDVFRDIAQLAVMAKGKPDTSTGAGSPNMERKQRRLSMANRFRAYFEGPKVEVHLASLEYLKSTLALLIQTLLLANATAEAKEKQAQADAISKAATDHVEAERIHVETLIIARQLTVNILEQKWAAEQGRDDQNGELSPTPSEDSLEGTKHPQLLEAPPSRSLVVTGHRNIPFLDRSLGSMEVASSTPQFTSHSQIIDQLLGRWTRLDEVERQIDRNRERQRVGPPVNGSAPDFTLTKYNSPEETASPLSTTPPYSTQLEVRPPHPHANSLPPPPRNTANYRVNSQIPLSLNRTLSTPEYNAINLQMRPKSPQPNAANALAVRPEARPPNPYRPPPPLTLTTHGSPGASPKGSYVGSSQFSNYRAPHVTESSEDLSTDTESDNDDDTKMAWRIQDGRKYWDLLEDKVIGPRTPLQPTETLEWLVRNVKGSTVIREFWVSEPALKESPFRYESIRVEDEHWLPEAGATKPKSERQWVIKQVLAWPQVEHLMERTAEIYGANMARREAATRSPKVDTRTRRPTPKGPPVQPFIHQQQMPPHPLSPQTPQDVNARAFAAMGQGPQVPVTRSAYDPNAPRPPTAGSMSSASQRSPRGSTENAHAPNAEKKLRFGDTPGAQRPPRREHRRREGEHDREGSHKEYSDESEYEKQKQQKRKRNKRTAKVMGSIAGIAAMLEGLDVAF